MEGSICCLLDGLKNVQGDLELEGNFSALSLTEATM